MVDERYWGEQAGVVIGSIVGQLPKTSLAAHTTPLPASYYTTLFCQALFHYSSWSGQVF